MTTQSVGDNVSPTAFDLAIVTAAEQFAARGYLGTTIDDILYNAPTAAVRSEIARFQSKGLIAVAVSTAAFAGFPFVTFQDNGHTYSGLTRIAICCHAVTGRFLNDTVARAANRLKREAFVIDTPMPEPFSTWFSLIEEMLIEAVASGEIREDVNPSVSAWMLVSTFYGMSELSQRFQLGEEVHNRIDIWLRAAFMSLGADDADDIIRTARSFVFPDDVTPELG